MRRRSLKHCLRKLRGLRRRMNAITLPTYRRAALRGWTPRRHDAIDRLAWSYRKQAASVAPWLMSVGIMEGDLFIEQAR
jgi:hypothetical protein